MGDLGGEGLGFGEKIWYLGFSEEAVLGTNFEFGVIRPKIRSVSLNDGYYFKKMVSPEIRSITKS